MNQKEFEQSIDDWVKLATKGKSSTLNELLSKRSTRFEPDCLCNPKNHRHPGWIENEEELKLRDWQ